MIELKRLKLINWHNFENTKLGYERCVDEIISYMKVRFPED